MRAFFVVGLLAAMAGIAAVSASRPSPVPPPPAPARPRVVGERLWFDRTAPVALTLPDGRREPVASMLNTRTPMRFGEFRWNEDGVPPGTGWVRIDLARQIISVFRGGHEIGTAVILYGTDGKPTPTGTFRVLAKAAAYRSRAYDADMPFMLRLTDDGVAIHASTVRLGSATHGCIGVPPEFARLLFGQVKRGGTVAILPA